MQLYYAAKDNGASEPWNIENEWVFDVQFLPANQWFFGVSRWPDVSGVVWSLCIGPIAITYFYARS